MCNGENNAHKPFFSEPKEFHRSNAHADLSQSMMVPAEPAEAISHHKTMTRILPTWPPTPGIQMGRILGMALTTMKWVIVLTLSFSFSCPSFGLKLDWIDWTVYCITHISCCRILKSLNYWTRPVLWYMLQNVPANWLEHCVSKRLE